MKRRGVNNKANNDTDITKKDEDRNRRKRLSVRLCGLHKEKGYRHSVKDFRACLEEKRMVYFDVRGRKAASESSESTRWQQQKVNAAEFEWRDDTVGRVTTLRTKDKSSFHAASSEGEQLHVAQGRAGDGSDESITLSHIAEHAAFNETEPITKISSITAQVALKDGAGGD